jgi:hypothetical protein
MGADVLEEHATPVFVTEQINEVKRKFGVHPPSYTV